VSQCWGGCFCCCYFSRAERSAQRSREIYQHLFVSSLATAIGIKYGPQSDLFVLALVFAAIVIYDAMNIRYQSGLHAHALNALKGEKKLNESLGHLPSETLIGSMIGVFVAAFFMQI
jgi:acid phosphatase family membrane protein YuiD